MFFYLSFFMSENILSGGARADAEQKNDYVRPNQLIARHQEGVQLSEILKSLKTL